MRISQTRVCAVLFAIVAGACAQGMGNTGYGNAGGSSGGGGGGSGGAQNTSTASGGGGSEDSGLQASSSGGSSGVQPGGSSSGPGGSSGSPGGSTSSSSTSSSSSGSGSGSSSGTVTTTGTGPQIPAASGSCPTLATGNITVMGQSVSIWAGTKQAKGAPILFYWHGTGSSASEAQLIMGTQITEITGEGGLVASFSTSTGMGTNTGDNVWYTGDFAMADQILACAVQQLNIDTRQIYTAGCSAGGLQSGTMVYSRNSYLAAAMPNSGGVVFPGTFEAGSSHVPSLITTHGGSSDMVVISFSTTSMTEDNDIAMKGGYVVDCNHGGGHCGAPANDIAAQWQFCKDHPFGVSPNPYTSGLPASFPSYCTIIH